MNIGFWRVSLFFFVVAAATIIVFPFDRNMVFLHLETGELTAARTALDRALGSQPDDFDLLVAASDLYSLEGKPDLAIASLEKALKDKPGNLRALRRLARLLEWNLRPRDAIFVYERIAEEDPKDTAALNKIINYARYYGMEETESAAIARLAVLGGTGGDTPASGFLPLLRTELRKQAELRLAEGHTPESGFLLRRLHVLVEDYSALLTEKRRPDDRQYATYAFEDFLLAGKTAEAEAFAGRLDTELAEGGLEHRLLLVTVMRWNGLSDDALAYLAALEEKYPDNEQILLAEVETSRDQDNLPALERAYEKLLAARPDRQDYTRSLTGIYMEGGKYGKAVDLQKRLLSVSGEGPVWLRELLKTALSSRDETIMRSAEAEAERHEFEDPDVLNSRADLLLALNRPEKAFPLVLSMVMQTGGGRPTLHRLFNIAIASGDPALVGRASVTARAYHPRDIPLMRVAASGYAAVDRPDLAYPLLKEIALAGRTRADAYDMLETAGFSGKARLVEDAARTAEALFSDDQGLMAFAGEICLWINRPGLAYPYFRLAALASGGEKGAVRRMVEVASYTNDPALFESAIHTGLSLRPGDADLRRSSAEFLLARGDDAGAARELERYLRRRPGDDDARRQLAYLLLWSGKGEEGERQMRLIGKRRGNDRKFLEEWARFAESAGQNEQAFALYDRLHRLEPGNAGYREAVVRLALYTDRPAIAAGILAAQSDRRPDDFRLAAEAADAYGQAGETGLALRYWERAAKLRPRDEAVLRRLAEYYGYEGDTRGVISAYERLAALSPLSAQERRQLAQGYVESGEGEKAVPYLEPILRRDRLPVEDGILLARAYAQSGRPGESLALYRRLAQENRSDPKLLAELGDSSLGLGNSRQALIFYRQALKLDPHNLRALRGSGMVYADNSDAERAIRQFNRYLRKRGDDAEIRFMLGEIYSANNRTGEADRQYRKTLRLLRKKQRPTARAGQ